MKCWTRPDPYLTHPELMALLLLSVTSLKSERSSNSANCGEQKKNLHFLAATLSVNSVDTTFYRPRFHSKVEDRARHYRGLIFRVAISTFFLEP